MTIYRFDDGATYHVVAKDPRGMFRALFDVDADDGWEGLGGVKWRTLDPTEPVSMTMEGKPTPGLDVPTDATIDEHGRWTAPAGAWADLCDKPRVLCCSEWP